MGCNVNFIYPQLLKKSEEILLELSSQMDANLKG